MARKVDLIVIHCSDTPNGRTLFTGKPGDPDFITPIQEIDRWHRERGFARQQGWRDKQEPALASIGYHFVVYTRGAVAACRHVDEVGAHARGYNATSIGVCLIGRDAFARTQWDALRELMCGYAKGVEQHGSTGSPRTGPGAPRRFGNPSPAEAMDILARAGIRVVGHRDIDTAKSCPNFDVRAWLESGMTPPFGQVYLDPVESPPTPTPPPEVEGQTRKA